MGYDEILKATGIIPILPENPHSEALARALDKRYTIEPELVGINFGVVLGIANETQAIVLENLSDMIPDDSISYVGTDQTPSETLFLVFKR